MHRPNPAPVITLTMAMAATVTLKKIFHYTKWISSK